jgi:glutathione S-transferase
VAKLAADPAARALARLWIFRHDTLTRPYYALRRGENGAAQRLAEQLSRLDGALATRPWLGGTDYGLADIAYVPWILRARDLLGVSLDPHRRLLGWLERLLERSAVAEEAEVVAAL